ncbi:MAG: NAD(P)H-dependent glycerol-3-phosphate dehydrogenase [Pseudomonadales bacterium]
MKIGVLGAGSWGTTVAHLLARRYDVTLWARDRPIADEINQRQLNSKYLGPSALSPRIFATDDLESAVNKKALILVAIPAQNFRAVLKRAKAFLDPEAAIISLSKGLELETGARMTEIIESVCPDQTRGVLTGPNLAREIMSGFAAASVLATSNPRHQEDLQPIFHSPLFRVYTNEDVLGCELCGVLKNIIAIAAGMSDGLGAGGNTRSAIVTRGLAEMTRLGIAMGAKPETFAGLAGMGDLVATCTSEQSRNHQVGVALGKGQSIKSIIDQMFMVAEGVKSAQAVTHLAARYSVAMPIAAEVAHVVSGDSDAQQSFRALLKAGIGREDEPF